MVHNDLAVLAVMEGRVDEARAEWQVALEIDGDCLLARLNRDLAEAEISSLQTAGEFGELKLAPAPCLPVGAPPSDGGYEPGNRLKAELQQGPAYPSDAAGSDADRPLRVAILSFLFNWPSTGGGNHHTAEMARFLGRAGYDLKHFFARFDSWRIGRVTDELISPSEAIAFDEASWNVAEIQARFRLALDGFTPDFVIITDSWNMKPLLAEAVRGYPFFLLYQTQENICPLNNLRLLASGPNQVEQCPRNQLATPEVCCRCLAERGCQSGALHRAERELAGVGTREYYEKLRRSLDEAEAVMVLNPAIEAMMQPFARRVCVVPWGMDATRFPWPPRDGACSSAIAKEAAEGARESEAPAELRGALPSGSAGGAASYSATSSTPSPSEQSPSGAPATLFMAAVAGETIKGYHVAHEACRILRQTRSDFELVVTFDPAGQIDEFTRSVGWCSLADLPRHYRRCQPRAVDRLHGLLLSFAEKTWEPKRVNAA